MTKEEKYSIAKWAMEHALQHGAQDVRVSINTNNSSQIDVREGKIDKLTEANQNTMRISLYTDNKYSSISTSRLNNKDELGRFIEDAITGTKYLSEDEFRQLPDPDLYYTGGGDDLKTMDKEFDSVDPQIKIQQALDVEKEVLGKDERIVSVTTTYNDEMGGNVMITSNGFEGDSESSSYYLYAEVSVKDESARPSSSWYELSVFHRQLPLEGIGEQALKRALNKLGQQKIASGKMPMIVENRLASRLVAPLISALYGSSIQQKNSFLIDMKGERIGSDLLNIIDDPFIISGIGSRHYDSEGLATRKRVIADGGVLKDYFIDTYYGKKLGMDPTSGRITNLVFDPGELDLKGWIGSIDRGILVTGFNGGNSNGSTGDFSYGIEGFLVENGELKQPVSEMNITGNFKQLWNNLAGVGSDVYTGSSWRLPSLVFDNVDFSGI